MTFLERVRNEPALITGVLLAVFNLLAIDTETSSSIVTIISAVLPLVLAAVVRQNVSGPVTSKTLAEAVETVKDRALRNPDAPVESAAPPLKAVRAAKRVLK